MSSRLSLILAVCGFAFLNPANAQTSKPAVAPATAPATKIDAASQAFANAALCMDKNDLDGALTNLTDAINANPKMVQAYVGRASIYYQKKMWPQAEQDFKSALALAPDNVVIKLNLAEVKFAQKQYEAARNLYTTMVTDVQMGDLAAYKAFLCDLLLGKDAAAMKERDAFDLSVRQPSFYFANAAWDIYHKNPDKARGWLVSVSSIYPSAKIAYYAIPLKDLGWLPLPPPKTTGI